MMDLTNIKLYSQSGCIPKGIEREVYKLGKVKRVRKGCIPKGIESQGCREINPHRRSSVASQKGLKVFTFKFTNLFKCLGCIPKGIESGIKKS